MRRTMAPVRRLTLSILVCMLAGHGGQAWAESLDAERFTPATGAEKGFAIEHPSVPFHLGWGLGLFFDLADDPVVEADEDGDVLRRPLDTAASLDLLGALGLCASNCLCAAPVVYRSSGATPVFRKASSIANAGACLRVPHEISRHARSVAEWCMTDSLKNQGEFSPSAVPFGKAPR